MSPTESNISIDPKEMNRRASEILLNESAALITAGEVVQHRTESATIWDFGVHHAGSDLGGILLARISASDLLDVELDRSGANTEVVVSSQCPVVACLGSQYAGWPVSLGKYFAMASGPGRILRGKEPLWNHFAVESSEANTAVLVLESDQLPDEEVIAKLAENMHIAADQIQPDRLHVCVAPTHSLAGTLQIVARSLETALHQWEVQQGPLAAIVSGKGRAPLPEVGSNSLQSIGLTNDSIIYGGEVELVIDGDWELLAAVAKTIPSQNSESFGQSFMELFAAAGNDFYKMDARLFSPAVLHLRDNRSPRNSTFGETRLELTSPRRTG